jgi:hypothetical protein
VSPQGQIRTGESFHSWRLLPESSAKPQPDCIPAVLRNDYIEACRIKDLSSKASATLARRCLQGMIRDFAKISRATLDLEIKELRRRVEAGNAPQGVTSESVEGIDHVRTIGNIGAHMEKDVNLVVEIEPGEAQALIELFEEWYIEREARSARLAKVAAMSAQKKTARLQATSSPPSPVPEQEQILEREVVSEELSVVGSGPPVDSEATKVAQ